MTNEYQYGYLLAGHGQARWRRASLADLVRMRRARKRREKEWRLFV